MAVAMLVTFTGSTVIAGPPSSGEVPSKISSSATEAEKRQRVAIELAPIKSEEELKEYLSTVQIGKTPLRYLTPQSRRIFVDSLIFTARGLASFRFRELEAELTPSQAYELLRLFGLQESAKQLTFARIETETDAEIMSSVGILTDYPDRRCDPPATCVWSVGDICIGQNCGMIEP